MFGQTMTMKRLVGITPVSADCNASFLLGYSHPKHYQNGAVPTVNLKMGENMDLLKVLVCPQYKQKEYTQTAIAYNNFATAPLLPRKILGQEGEFGEKITE